MNSGQLEMLEKRIYSLGCTNQIIIKYELMYFPRLHDLSTILDRLLNTEKLDNPKDPQRLDQRSHARDRKHPVNRPIFWSKQEGVNCVGNKTLKPKDPRNWSHSVQQVHIVWVLIAERSTQPNVEKLVYRSKCCAKSSPKKSQKTVNSCVGQEFS